MRGVFLEDLTWPKACACVAAGALVMDVTGQLDATASV
jgi:hypothetical protein